MAKHLEASVSIIDHMNPGFGYQLVITDGRHGGEVLRTACNPATGDDLLTFEQCLDVLEMYRRQPRTA